MSYEECIYQTLFIGAVIILIGMNLKQFYMFCLCVEWIINCLSNDQKFTPNFWSFNERFMTYTQADNFYNFSRS